MKKTMEADKMQQTCFGEKVFKEGEEKKEKKKKHRRRGWRKLKTMGRTPTHRLAP